MKNMEGKVWKFRDCIDTDVIIAGRYLRTFNPEDLAAHVMEAEDPEFAGKVNKGDIIVGGWNFGCGSSREQAPVAIKTAGVSVIIAKSFARIFYRNAINIGLTLVEAHEGPDEIEEEDTVKIDLENGTLTNKTKNQEYVTTSLPEFMFEILENDGLIKYLNKTRFNE